MQLRGGIGLLKGIPRKAVAFGGSSGDHLGRLAPFLAVVVAGNKDETHFEISFFFNFIPWRTSGDVQENPSTCWPLLSTDIFSFPAAHKQIPR